MVALHSRKNNNWYCCNEFKLLLLLQWIQTTFYVLTIQDYRLICVHTFQYIVNGPLTRYVQLRVAHAPGISGTFSPPLSDPDMYHGTCVTSVAWCMSGSLPSSCLWSRWRGKLSRYSRRMRNPQFYVSGKRPMEIFDNSYYFGITPISFLVDLEGHLCSNVLWSAKIYKQWITSRDTLKSYVHLELHIDGLELLLHWGRDKFYCLPSQFTRVVWFNVDIGPVSILQC